MKIEDKINCKVPFGTVSIPSKAVALIADCLDKKRVTNGKYVAEFEEKFAKKFGVKYAVAVSSGTDAVTLALASLYDFGAERGDEIILPALTFVATANAVVQAGFKPVFVDVCRDTFCINPLEIESKITKKTRAIIAVHLMGRSSDSAYLKKRFNLPVIEDTAEAHGGTFLGKMLGTVGYAGCFSLYAAHIVTSIEGGMIITNDEKVYNSLKSLRNHGLELNGSDWTFERIGFSAKMNELEASVGIANIEIFEDILEKRRYNFRYLNCAFMKPPFNKYFSDFMEFSGEEIGPHAFPFVLRSDCPFTKKEFVDYLSRKGIDNRNLFYSIPTQCKSYSYLGHKLGDFPVAEYISDNGTHIGCHQDLNQEQLDYIVESIRNFIILYDFNKNK